MTDPRAVLAPAWSMTSVWSPRSRRPRVSHDSSSRTRAMFVCRVLIARQLTHIDRTAAGQSLASSPVTQDLLPAYRL
eukprot:6231939-Prymnesium_polylepis.1